MACTASEAGAAISLPMMSVRSAAITGCSEAQKGQAVLCGDPQRSRRVGLVELAIQGEGSLQVQLEAVGSPTAIAGRQFARARAVEHLAGVQQQPFRRMGDGAVA